MGKGAENSRKLFTKPDFFFVRQLDRGCTAHTYWAQNLKNGLAVTYLFVHALALSTQTKIYKQYISLN